MNYAKLMLSLMIFVLTVALSACMYDANTIFAVQQAQENLDATWESADFEESSMGGFTFRRYQFNEDGSWNSSFSTYAAQDFTSGGFTVEEEGIDYTVLRPHATLADTYILELTRGKIFLTIRDMETYNQMAEFGLFSCIAEDQIGRRVEVTNTPCPPIPPLADCLDEYELMQMTETSITFGERGLDNCSDMGVGDILSNSPLDKQ